MPSGQAANYNFAFIGIYLLGVMNANETICDI